MPAKSLALLPFSFSSHSAAAACKACERTRKGGRQHGTTEPCRRPVRCRRHARCSARRRSRCSSCRFEFSSSQLRSDADMSACSSVFQVGCSADRCFSHLCMRVCRENQCPAVPQREAGLGRQAAVRAVPCSTHQRRCASTLRRWQSTQIMHRASEPTRRRHPHACRTGEAAI